VLNFSKRKGEPKLAEEKVGEVSKFFAKPVVAGIELTAPVKVGDRIRIEGHTTNLEFAIESMQVQNASVEEGKPGDSIGIKVPDRVREGDGVYRII
jgi:translation elongation factor EF-1alpha